MKVKKAVSGGGPEVIALHTETSLTTPRTGIKGGKRAQDPRHLIRTGPSILDEDPQYLIRTRDPYSPCVLSLAPVCVGSPRAGPPPLTALLTFISRQR